MSLQGRVPFSRGQVIAAPTKKKDTGSWPEIYSKKVDMKKVKRDAFQPWITKRISKLMGGEDEVIESYVVEMLAAAEVEPKAPLHPTTRASALLCHAWHWHNLECRTLTVHCFARCADPYRYVHAVDAISTRGFHAGQSGDLH